MDRRGRKARGWEKEREKVMRSYNEHNQGQTFTSSIIETQISSSQYNDSRIECDPFPIKNQMKWWWKQGWKTRKWTLEIIENRCSVPFIITLSESLIPFYSVVVMLTGWYLCLYYWRSICLSSIMFIVTPHQYHCYYVHCFCNISFCPYRGVSDLTGSPVHHNGPWTNNS